MVKNYMVYKYIYFLFLFLNVMYLLKHEITNSAMNININSMNSQYKLRDYKKLQLYIMKLTHTYNWLSAPEMSLA